MGGTQSHLTLNCFHQSHLTLKFLPSHLIHTWVHMNSTQSYPLLVTPLCSCGMEEETISNILLNCPQYVEARDHMINKIERGYMATNTQPQLCCINTKTLLGTNHGIPVHKRPLSGWLHQSHTTTLLKLLAPNVHINCIIRLSCPQSFISGSAHLHPPNSCHRSENHTVTIQHKDWKSTQPHHKETIYSNRRVFEDNNNNTLVVY